MDSSNKKYILPLTSLRFFAAFFVMLSHLSYLKNTNLDFLFVNEGFISVTFFFILSGFILTFSYQDRFLNKKTTIPQFYFARIARIYPIHIITFLISILLFSVGHYSFKYYLFNITLIQSYIPNKKYYFTFNYPSWSLSVEMFFYLLFPFLLKLKNKTLFLIASVLIIIKMIILFDSHEKTHAFMYISPLFRLQDFIIGILLFRFRKNEFFEIKGFYVSLLQIISILLLFTFVMISENINISYRYDIYYIFPMAFIIYSFSLSDGIIGNCISNRFIVLLGEASFSLYMIHQLVIRFFLDISNKDQLLNWKLPVVIITISIILSVFMFQYLEIPLKNKTYKFLNKLFCKKTKIN